MMIKEEHVLRRDDHLVTAMEGQVRQGEIWPLTLAKCNQLSALIFQ